MKNLVTITLTLCCLLAFTTVNANQSITNNTTCTYQVIVLFAPFSCTVSTLTTVTVPPNSTVIVPCPSGEFPIATVVRETIPGINQLVIVGDPFCGYSRGINSYGNCNAGLRYFIGSATNFLTIN